MPFPKTAEGRERAAAHQRDWRLAHPGADKRDRSVQTRKSRLKRYGLTPEEYDVMQDEQGGRCAACGRPETSLGNHGKVKRLAVDHNHETGEVRGLLCLSCNVALGLVDDDVNRLLALAEYLRSKLVA